MIVIGAILAIILSYVITISIIVPRRLKRKQQKISNAPMLPAPQVQSVLSDKPSRRVQAIRDIESRWNKSGRSVSQFYRDIGAKNKREALKLYRVDKEIKGRTKYEQIYAEEMTRFVNNLATE